MTGENTNRYTKKIKRAQRSWRFMKAVPRTLHGEARHIPFDGDDSLLELITNNCILRYGSAAANGHFQAYKQLYWLEFDEESSHFYVGLGGGEYDLCGECWAAANVDKWSRRVQRPGRRWARALRVLSSYYKFGYGVPIDEARADELLHRAADEGDVMAQLELVAEKEQIEAEERHQVLLEIARCQKQHNKELKLELSCKTVDVHGGSPI